MKPLLLLAALLVILIHPATADMYGSGPVPQPRLQPAYRADAFVDAMGLTADPYNAAFPDLGVRYYRTGLRDITQPWAAQPARIQQMADLWAKYGVRPMLLLDALRFPVAENMQLLKLYPPGLVAEIEGPNEANNKFPPQVLNLKYKGLTDEAAGTAYQNDFMAALRADPTTNSIPLVAFTAIFTDYRLAKPCASFDFNNMHSYQGYDIPSASLEMNTTRANNLLPVGATTKPFVPSECGYNVEEDVSNHTGISGSLQAQALNIPMLYAEYFRHGIKRTYLFALQNTDGYGLLNSDSTRRPSYNAVKNLVATLSDATWNPQTKTWDGGDFTPRALLFDLPGAPQSVHTLVLQKKSGEYFLLIWHEVVNYDAASKQEANNPPVPVSVTFRNAMQPQATILTQNAQGGYDTTAAVLEHGTLHLQVPSSVMIVRLRPAAAPRGALPAPAGVTGQGSESAVQLHWQPVPGAAGYFIYRNGWHIATTTTQTSYRDQSSWLRPGLGFTYEVQAFTAAGVMSPRSAKVVQTAARFPDLAITALYADPANPQPGEQIHLVTKVTNVGDGATPPGIPVGATWMIDGKVIGWKTPVGPINPGEEWTMTSDAWTATPGAHVLTCVLDDINRLPGENKQNNIADCTLQVGATTGGELRGATQAAPGAVDLTREGTLDWIHWGLNGKDAVNRKAGANLFGALTKQGEGYCDATAGCPVAISWQDGTPTAKATDTHAGLWWNVVGTAQTFTAPADTTERVLRVYVAGIEGAAGTLTATLSDNSAPAYSSSAWNGDAAFDWAPVPGGFSAVYEIRYRAASAGQHLSIAWKLSGEPNQFRGQARLQAATLAAGG